MTPAAFFAALWPTTGFYCIASLDQNKVLKHHWYETPEQAGEAALRLDETGRTVYHACASFKEKNSRKQENAHASRAIWIDLDVGEGPLKYPTVQMAAAGLRQFLDTTALPVPTMLISSGGGLHVYWCFEDDIAVPQWHGTAALVKRLAAHHKFLIDPTRTADISSILRPVGTHNWKYKPPREVKYVTGHEVLSFGEFAADVGTLASALPVLPVSGGAPRTKLVGVNAKFTIDPNYDPTDANLVADKCAQIRWFRDSQGNLPEPVWYAGIGVVAKCENGREVVHEWSSGFPSYSAKETDAKLNQVEGVGPTTCSHFSSINPTGCVGCPHAGNITSPIRLGVRLSATPIATPPDDTDAFSGGVEAPLTTERYAIPKYGYTKNGMVYEEKDKPPITFYPYDLYVQEIAYDDVLMYEVAIVKHFLPQEGWKEFAIRSSVVSSDEKCETALRDNHIKPWHSRVMRNYLTRCMEHVQREKRMRKLYGSLGWKDGTDFFVLGDIAYYKDGHQEPVGLSPTIAGVASGIHSKGDVQKWVDATSVLDRPGMEAHALVWAIGPGAPLMKFTGFEGALINAVGPSSSGKTSMARFALSMYGDFDKLKLKQRDTVNAKIQRIAVLGSLPAYVDEITNENPQEVSDFIYEITQGRSKLRLKVDGSERLTQAWNTVVLSSSNTSLSNKLGLAKSNPEAERLRLFELPVHKRGEFDDLTGRELKHVIDENYGVVGEVYIAYVVEHQERIRRELGIFMDQFRAHTESRTEERMWVASLCCCLYGAKIMHDLGLSRIDVKRLVRYAVATVRRHRKDMDDAKYDPVTLLGLYLNEFASFRLTVVEQKMHAGAVGVEYILKRAPVGELRMRYDMTQNTMWIDKKHFRDWLATHHENYTEVRDYMIREQVMVRECGKTLGSGTEIASSNVPCVEINMLSKALGNMKIDAPEPPSNVVQIR
jgi:hypothetical protein